jgi:hypothetical protein
METICYCVTKIPPSSPQTKKVDLANAARSKVYILKGVLVIIITYLYVESMTLMFHLCYKK